MRTKTITAFVFLVAVLAIPTVTLADQPGEAIGLEVLGIPAEFILFAGMLVSVAMFHRHTLQIAITGLVGITLYKLLFAGFHGGGGLGGLAQHLTDEWALLANLLGLLLGFALLARHFEESRV